MRSTLPLLQQLVGRPCAQLPHQVLPHKPKPDELRIEDIELDALEDVAEEVTTTSSSSSSSLATFYRIDGSFEKLIFSTI